MKLTAGRIVQYLPLGRDIGLAPDVWYPAMVVRAWSDTCATISVFTESLQEPLKVVWSANLGDGPGTWRWPVIDNSLVVKAE